MDAVDSSSNGSYQPNTVQESHKKLSVLNLSGNAFSIFPKYLALMLQT